MYFRNQMMRYGMGLCDEDPGGKGSGGGGGDDTAAKLEAMQKQITDLTTNLETVTTDRDKFKAKHTEAEKHRKEAAEAAAKAAEDAARKSGDVEAIENSWKEKLDKANTEAATTISGLQSVIQDVTIGAAATTMASELALDGSANVLKPHISDRLKMEMRDGVPHITVLKDGKPSALTLNDLREEISNDAGFAPILKGSSASGSGGAGQGNKTHTGKTMKRSEFDKLTPSEKAVAANGKDKVTIIDD